MFNKNKTINDSPVGSLFYENPKTNQFFGEAQLSVDVFETKEFIVIKSTVAGVKSESLEISISNDLLTIRGFRENDEEVSDDAYYTRECYWGAFSRSIVLPREIDQKKIDANIKNGILTIKLTKKYKTSVIKVKEINE